MVCLRRCTFLTNSAPILMAHADSLSWRAVQSELNSRLVAYSTVVRLTQPSTARLNGKQNESQLIVCLIHFSNTILTNACLQCFDTVGWVSGRASGLQKLSNEVMAWLSVCSLCCKVQMIFIWSSWCHCHPVISCFIKIQRGLTFLVLAYPGRPGKEAVKRASVCIFWSCSSFGWTTRKNLWDDEWNCK